MIYAFYLIPAFGNVLIFLWEYAARRHVPTKYEFFICVFTPVMNLANLMIAVIDVFEYAECKIRKIVRPKRYRR